MTEESKQGRKAQMEALTETHISVLLTDVEDGRMAVYSNKQLVRVTDMDVLADKVGWESVLVKRLQGGEIRTLGPMWLRRLALGLEDNRPEEVQQLHAFHYKSE